MDHYHDGTLRQVRFDWSTATVAVEVTIVPGLRRSLIVGGVTDIRVTHTQPWGPSGSVYELSIDQRPTGMRLTVQMQSGDVIEISGQAVTESEIGWPTEE